MVLPNQPDVTYIYCTIKWRRTKMFNSRILKSFVSHKIVFDGSLSEFPSLSLTLFPPAFLLSVCLSPSPPLLPLSLTVSLSFPLSYSFSSSSHALCLSLFFYPLILPSSLSPSPIMSFSPSFSHCLSQSNFCSYNTMV